MSDNIENHGERIANLESSVRAIGGNLESMSRKLDALAEVIANRSQTNWVTIFTGLGVIITLGGMFWAAAISPLEKGQARTDATQSKQQDSIQQGRDMRVVLTSEVDALKVQVADMREHGTANSDKRLTLIEWRMDHWGVDRQTPKP